MSTITIPYIGSEQSAREARRFLLQKMREWYRINSLFAGLQSMNAQLSDQEIDELLDEHVLETIRQEVWEEQKNA